MYCLFCMCRFHEPILIRHLFSKRPVLCVRCHEAMEGCRFESVGRCLYCKGVLDVTKRCMNCSYLKESAARFDQIEVAFHYHHFVKELMHQYKFLNDIALAKVFAAYVHIPRRSDDIIIPMPSSIAHDEQRTFNPVETILMAMKIPYVACLKMHHRTKQYQLSSAERHHAANPIYFDSDICLENKSVLLIDDIYTTGHTAHCAGDVLLQQKVRKLSMLTFAR